MQHHQRDARQMMSAGYQHFRVGHYQKALGAYEQAIALDPGLADAHYQKGHVLRKQKRWREALEAYAQASRLASLNAYAWYFQALMRVELQEYEEALLAYDQALRLAPHDPTIRVEKARLLEILHRYREALALYQQIIALEPASLRAYVARGRLLWSLRWYDEALAAFDDLVGQDVQAWVLVHRVVLRDPAPDANGLAAYERMIRRSPDPAMVYGSQGAELCAQRRYTEALAVYEQALRLVPSRYLYYHDIAHALRRLGRKCEAEEALQRAEDAFQKECYRKPYVARPHLP